MSPAVRNKRGSVIVLIAVSLVAMMGMAALAVDMGMLQKVRAEAQRAADAAALAGASAFLIQTGDMTLKIDSANARAQWAADTNYMTGVKVDTTSELTVWVIPDSAKVRVRVRRAAVGVWFAKIFGINSMPVGAKAAAEASTEGGGAACVKPVAFPDLWGDSEDTDGDGAYSLGENWLWNGDPPDVYHPANYDGEGTGTGLGSDYRNRPLGCTSPASCTGSTYRDWGLRIVMRPSVSEGSPNQACPGSLQGNKCYVPGWWGWWGGTVPDMRDKITGCDDVVYTLGETVPTEGGWKQTLNNAIQTVLERDEAAWWDETFVQPDGRVGGVRGSNLVDDWMESPRVWIVAMMHPADVPAVPSDNDTQFNNYVRYFVEGCVSEDGTETVPRTNCGTQDMLLARFLGPAPAVGTGPIQGTMLTTIKLVE